MDTRAVLFDLDDTLFDHTYCARTGLEAVREAHPALSAHPLTFVHQEFARLLDEMHPRVLSGELTLEQSRCERVERLLRWSGCQPSESEVLTFSELYRRSYQDARRPVPSARALLEALHMRVVVGVVTNNITSEQVLKLRHCGLDRSIDFMVTSEDVGVCKPHAPIFDEALRRAGCRPAEAVMVGDSWESDVVGARQAGLRAVWFNRSHAAPPGGSTATMITSLQPAQRVAALVLAASEPLGG